MRSYKQNSLIPSKERVVIHFNTLDPALDFILGRVKQAKADGPIESHIHPDSFEIVYIVKGEQVYTVDNTPYLVKSGQCFLTFPNESHSSGNYPEDKSFLYYLIFPTSIFSFLGFNSLESKEFLFAFLNLSHRVFSVDSSMSKLLESLIHAALTPAPLNKTRIRLLLTQYLITLMDCLSLPSDDSPCTLSPILDYIDQHITEAITLQDLYPLMGLSESRFKAYFREVIGIPPAEYILRQKINHAKNLLTDSSLTITDIAYTLSFSSSQYFCTAFKRFTTLSPSQYRSQKS